MKKIFSYLPVLLLLSTFIYSCREKIDADFSYSPEEPVVGQTVTFTNLSSGGEDFDWTFTNLKTSSVGRSIAENPTRTFTVPGEYSIKLRVDSNNNFVRTKYLYVYDSIPTIERSAQNVYYFENVTFSALAYNPFKRTKTFQWFFSENASSTGKALRDTVLNEEKFLVSYEESPTVFFSKKEINETVRLRMTIGDSIYTNSQIKAQTFYINDTETRSLLMARKDEKMLRQRIFENGIEEPIHTNINLQPKHPFNIAVLGNQLFIFDAGTHIEDNEDWENDTSGDGAVYVVSLENDSHSTVISNTGKSAYYGFYNGYVEGNIIYWTDRNQHLYSIEKTKRNIQFNTPDNSTDYNILKKSSDIGAADDMNGGIGIYDRTYFWAKKGTGRGIYLFPQYETGTISHKLTNFAVGAFAIDKIFTQIYFSVTAPLEDTGFWVADASGDNARKIISFDDPAVPVTGIVIDNESQRVFWADRTGVRYMTLARSNTEPESMKVEYFNNVQDVYGIALDEVEK